MDVRELVTKLGFGYNGAGVAQYEGAVGRIKTLGAGLGTFLQTALAGVTVYALGRMVKSTIEFGDELLNSSKITGIAVEQLNQLRMAAKLANIDQGTLNSSLTIFATKLAKAQKDGKGDTFDAFKALGINPKQIKDTEQGFNLVTEALSKQEDGFKKTAAAREFFGRSGGTVIPMFGARNTEEFKKYESIVDAFGKGPNKLFAEQSDHINDSLDVFGMAMFRLKITIVGAMYPAITRMVDGMADWVAENKEFVSQGIEASLKGVGVVLTSIGKALDIIGAVAKFAYDNIVVLAPLLIAMAAPSIASGIGFLANSFLALASSIVAMTVAFLASPFAPAVAALILIGLLIDSIIAYVRGGESVIGDFIKLLGDGLDWVSAKIQKVITMLTEIFGEKAMKIAVQAGSLGMLNLENGKLKSTIDPLVGIPNLDTKKVPSGGAGNQSIKNVAPTFNSNATINVNVTNDGKDIDAQEVAEKVKEVAQKVLSQEYRTALLNLQGIENRGLA